MMKAVTLDSASDAFKHLPNNETAGIYLMVLMEYHENGMIGTNTMLDGISEVAVYLNPKMVRDLD